MNFKSEKERKDWFDTQIEKDVIILEKKYGQGFIMLDHRYQPPKKMFKKDLDRLEQQRNQTLIKRKIHNWLKKEGMSEQ